ncbi:MAG: pectin acetylesterase-family hydrolase [Myxococcota bacterium]|nr:pectin acetylesterase-family hydrolase [Myxococcota bacterium]
MRLLLVSVLAIFVACGPDAEGLGDAGPAVDAGSRLSPLPALADLTPETWTELSPGGDTTCSRGQDWGFFFRPGTIDKLVIEFQGGGACWNYATCSIADAIFKDNIEDVRDAVSQGLRRGIYDHTNPDNPFAGWHHLFIPYCTGDIHWGRATVEYTGENGAAPFILEHKGAVNSEVALRWVGENLPSPETIFVGGCSAGAYGSIGWAPYIMRDFPNSKVVQMGDCGAGIITDRFLQDSFPGWHALDTLPGWIENLDPVRTDFGTLELKDLYAEVGKFYPDQNVAQYNTVLDENQVFYYTAMGGEGDAEDWSVKMRDQIHRIADETPNFRSFIAPGEQHCILPRSNFYDVESDGVRLVDWLRELVGPNAPDSVACEGCEPQPLP